jgi:hypothetical protein
MFKKILKYFKRKRFNLRQACVDEYGEEFGELYDKINMGQPIGGFQETAMFLDMIKSVKRKHGIL